MSSPGLPTLNVDVSARRAERFIVIILIVATSGAASLLQQSLASTLLVAFCAAVSIGGAFIMMGWVGGSRRLTRIACQPDGRWLLSRQSGRTEERTLSRASRITAFAMWLEWTDRSSPMLLLPCDLPSDEFRRLVVRLRLSDTRIRYDAIDEA